MINSKKRITLLISSLKGGGAEKVCINVANELVNFGWTVDLLVLNLKNSIYQNQLSKNVRLIELHKISVRKSLFSLIKYIFKKILKYF